VSEGHAPVGVVLLSAEPKKPLELICAPKEIRPSAAVLFACKMTTSVGSTKAATIAFTDPCCADAASWLGANAMPPLWQYLFPL
jgi:hypothetical protein